MAETTGADKVVLNTYPCPITVNFDAENANGDYEVRTVTLMPGEKKHIDPADWESMKDRSAIQKGLDDMRILEGVTERQVEQRRQFLANNMLDTTLIGGLSKKARNSDLRNVAVSDIRQASEHYRAAGKEGQAPYASLQG